ncbi:hypothetical protein [Kitasatospora sp. NPDC001683]
MSVIDRKMAAGVALTVITFNPASHVELESAKRPKPLVWTEERIEQWELTGERPSSVMVWTPERPAPSSTKPPATASTRCST